MNLVRLISPFIVAVTLSHFTTVSFSQTTNADSIEAKFKGIWLVEVTEIVRALNITKISIGNDGVANVEATYSGASVKASINSAATPITLEITTAAGTVMSLIESSPATLSGTFTTGSASGAVSATKFSPKRNPDAIAKCGASEGVWEGKWSKGNFGTMTLWIGEVSNDCNAVVRYGRVKQSVSANAGAFSFECNPSTGGTCNFKPAGKELWASYNNPAGGANNAVFKQVE